MELLPPFAGAPQPGGIYHVDALELLCALPDNSVDAFILDLPYGTTACHWDEVIPFAPMWVGVKRTLKPRGVFVTTAIQPFTSKLVMSNLDWFRCEWVWNKVNAGTGLHADKQPLKTHENVIVFGSWDGNYYPQMTAAIRRTDKAREIPNGAAFSGGKVLRIYDNDGMNYPRSIITFSNAGQTDKEHPTQKPGALYRYLIETYTRPGELVVDFCCGSGTTAVAAFQSGRQFIAGDTCLEYVEIARRRLRQTTPDMFATFGVSA